jgi:hypothetical protein
MQFNFVKVFSATKARERERIGERLTEWLQRQPYGTEIVDTEVRQSSDREYHCLSIVLFGWSGTGVTSS